MSEIGMTLFEHAITIILVFLAVWCVGTPVTFLAWIVDRSAFPDEGVKRAVQYQTYVVWVGFGFYYISLFGLNLAKGWELQAARALLNPLQPLVFLSLVSMLITVTLYNRVTSNQLPYLPGPSDTLPSES